MILVGGGAAVGGGAPDRARGLRPARWWCRQPGEYVADGAARQAAWVALGGATPPAWALKDTEEYAAEPVPAIRERYAEARDHTLDRVAATGE